MNIFRFILLVLLVPGILKSSFAVAGDLPPDMQKLLEEHRQRNDLENWLYTWIDRLAEVPDQTLRWTETILENRWRPPQTEDEHSAWLLLLVNQGFNLLQHGNIIQSIAAYENAYHYYTQHPVMPGDEVIEYIILPLGNNYTRLGDYPRAMFIQEKGLSLVETGTDPQLQASLCNNLAVSCRWAGNLLQAAVYASRGLMLDDIAAAVRAQLLITEADIKLLREMPERATDNIQEALALLQTLPLTADIAQRLSSAHAVMGDLSALKQDYTAALSSKEHALQLMNRFFANSKPREKAKIWVEKGNLLLHMKQYHKALHCFSVCRELLLPEDDPQLVYAEATLLDAAHGMARVYIALDNPKKALEYYQTAFAVSEKLRQTFYSQSSKIQQQNTMRSIAESAIRLAYELYQADRDPYHALLALSVAEQHKARVLADELNRNIALGKLDETNLLVQQERRLGKAVAFYEGELVQARINKLPDTTAIRNKLKEIDYQLSLLQPRLSEHFPALKSRLPLTLQTTETQLRMLPGELPVMAYFCGKEQWYSFTFSRTGIRTFDRIGHGHELDSLVSSFSRKYFLEGPAALYNHPRQYYEEAAYLYTRLFKVQPTESTLMIVADGPLSQLPFDALITPGQAYSPAAYEWPYLTRKLRLSQAYSLANWSDQQQYADRSRKKTGHFAGFFIPFRNVAGHSELPAVHAEMNYLKRRISGDFFWDDEASSATLQELLPQSDVVHISTHAVSLGREKMPALLFRDKQVLISDLYQVMVQPSLVVLGACKSGVGMLDDSEGMISLAREFIAGGSGGVVSGLWNINDETAARFMDKFYRHLVAGETKPQALHLAKMDWLTDPEVPPLHKLPYYWAGLIYNGDFDRLELRTPHPWWMVPAAAFSALFLLAAVGYKFRRKITGKLYFSRS